ncbi:hypothetical protein JL721_12054 [Aureococcus anophagefferens]|nr:hypothetical protein JL721_12054 [Aureococcus anophagefferens]
MLKIFAQIDHDRSDMIERGELEAFMKTQGRHMENFKSLDWNDDGKMDKREYTQSTHEEATAIFALRGALRVGVRQRRAQALAEQSEEDIRRILVLFSLFDKDKTSDKTGEIDATELSNLAAVLGGSDLKEICREEHVTAEVAEAVTVADIDTGVSNGIRDGVIDHDEFLKWYSSPAAVVADARPVFGAAFFSSAFLGAPLFSRCRARRAPIMTGRYQIRVGIQHGCYGASQGTGLPLGGGAGMSTYGR